MKTFVFAIGGTGARVLRALTMLMASDIDVKQTIIPVIIDMDTRNGDAQRTLKTLDLYRIISQSAYAESVGKGFFKNQFGTLGSINQGVGGEEVDTGIKDSFQLDFGDVNVTFYDYIKGSQLSKVDNDLLETLFDNSPQHKPNTELNLKLDHGFKGNPNIGSVVFNNLINTPEFRHFENVFSQGDRIFIISSIFGGTGSSGFPQLVKNLRASNNNFIKSANIGAIVVKPYFRVKKDAQSSINSDTFNSKTKSALTYYADELDGKINEVYYIADRPGEALENHMGGEDQKNTAHLVELLAAKAVVKFANKDSSEFKNGDSKYFEFGILDAPNGNPQGLDVLGFEDFYTQEEWEDFAKFSFFAKFYRQGLPQRKKEDFYRDLNLSDNMKRDVFYVKLTDFIDKYWLWLSEMERSQRSFSPFLLNGDFSKFFKGKGSIKKLDKSMFTDIFTKSLSKLWKDLKAEGKIRNEEKFIKMMYLCIEEIFKAEVQSLPVR